MELTFLILFFLSLLPPSTSFGCNSVYSSSLCSQMNLCTWNGTDCTGTFTPICSGTCYYIDPVGGSDSANGTVLTPFRTLTPGFQKLSGVTGTLSILNSALNIEVQLLNYTSITSVIVMSPIFSLPYVLNLQNLNLSTIPSSQSYAIYIASSRLEIYGCTFNEKTVKSGINTVFELNSTAKLWFNNVSISDYQGSANLIRVGTDKTTSQLNYTNGLYQNSSFTFQLPTGSHILKGVQFINNKASSNVLYLGTTLDISNIYVKGGSSLFIRVAPQTTLTITNLTMDQYNGNFLDATSVNRFTFTNSTLMNSDSSSSSTPFIRLSGAGTSFFSFNPHSLKSVVFQNITVRNSLFLLEKNSQVITVDNITMNDIKKKSILSSERTLDDIEYQSEWPGGVCFLGRQTVAYTITKSNFTKINSHCIGLKASALALTSNYFDNSALDYQASTISEDTIDESYGVTWLNFQSGTSTITPGITVKITTNKFYNNKKYPKYGGAMRFNGIFTISILSLQNEFVNNRALYGGAIYITNPLTFFNSTGDIFRQNYAKQGGAIYKVTEEANSQTLTTSSVSINSSNFIENVATDKGGSLYFNLEVIRVENSNFTRCQAINGGAIYFIKMKAEGLVSSSLNFGFYSNIFDSNVAKNSGGAIKLLFDYSSLRPNSSRPSIFTNNTDFKGLSISDGKPSHYIFSLYDIITRKKLKSTDNLDDWINNSSLTKLAYKLNTSSFPSDYKLAHKSGHELTQILLVEIYDNRNELADYINNEGIIVTMTESNNNISDFEAFIGGSSVSFSFSRGRLLMKSSVKIVGEPKTTAKMTFEGRQESSDLLNDAQFRLNQQITVDFIDCQVGDVFNSLTRKCDTCGEGTYSLSDPYSNAVCLTCDNEKAICLGGSELAPRPGYWRFDINTSNFMDCPQSDACIGGYFEELYSPRGECVYPYQGNLCNKCADGYAKFGSSSGCANCETDAMYYLKFAGFGVLQIAALLYTIKCNVSKISDVKKAYGDKNEDLKSKLDNEDFQSNLMKVIVNFLQISTIILQYQFEWPSFIISIIGVTNKFVPSEKDGFSVDCILALIAGKSDDVYFIKLVITLLQPFFIWLFLILLYIVYLKIKKEPIKGNPDLKQSLFVLFIIAAFLLQPNIIQSTLEIFKCENFSSKENPIYFMVENSETECWTFVHIIWGLAVALPNFLLWALILPGLLLGKLKLNAKKLKDPDFYARYSFVYEGLKTHRYYWEFVIMARKILIVMIFVFFSFISVQGQAFATFLVLLAFGILHYIHWPYVDESLNRSEMLSLVSLGIMTYCGMFFLSNGGNDWLNTILIVVTVLFNLLFFVFLAILFIKSYKKTAVRIKKSITQAAGKIKEKIRTHRSSQSNISEKRSNSVEIKDLSSVLNKIHVDSPAEQISEVASPVDVLRHFNNIEYHDFENNRQDEEDIVPGDSPVVRSKTVYNEDRNDINNYSILKSSLPRRSTAHRHSAGSQITQDMLQDMILLYNVRRSSPFNSNEQKYLARSFSSYEKAVGLIMKENSDAHDEDENNEHNNN